MNASPYGPQHQRMRALTGTLSAEGIMASGQNVPRKQAEHMAAPTNVASEDLPTRSRPHMACSGSSQIPA